MCLDQEWKTGLVVRWAALWLSHHKMGGEVGKQSSWRSDWIHTNSAMGETNPLYSNSALLLEAKRCLEKDQDIRFEPKKTQ